ncbi:hypothetical protein L0F63_004919, partial [Massospora cicadina]
MRVGLIALGLHFVAGQQRNCDHIDERQEIRDMTPENRTIFFDAIVELSRQGGTPSDYDKIVRIHVENNPKVHSVPVFLPWHRYYLIHLQDRLREINPSIVIPYWNSSHDNQQPEESSIFTPDFFGGNGAKQNHCVTDGPFTLDQGFNVTTQDDDVNSTSARCLRRSFDSGNAISPFSLPETVQQIIENSDFGAFSSNIERAPHALPHNNIGGMYGDISSMSSPNDPIFWVHHGLVDYWWSIWQETNRWKDNDSSIRDMENDKLPGFHNITVRDTLDTKKYPFCYRYAPQMFGISIQPQQRETQNQMAQSEQSPSQTSQPSLPTQADQAPSINQNNNRRSGVTPVIPGFGSASPAITPAGENKLQKRDSNYADNDLKKLESRRQRRLAKLNITEAMRRQSKAYIAQIEASCPRDICPHPLDRQDLRRLRVPRPIPLDWIVSMNLGIHKTRRQEIGVSKFIKKLNLDPNYVSPSALVNWDKYHTYSNTSSSKSSSSKSYRKRTSKKTTVTKTV